MDHPWVKSLCGRRESIMIRLVQVSSSCIRAVGYDVSRQVLIIHFVRGAFYEYSQVPESVHEALLSAESKGKYFTAHVRDVYRANEIQNPTDYILG